MEKILEIGKKIFDLQKELKTDNMSLLFKKLDLSEKVGRNSYWIYMFMIECELKKKLEESNKEYLLNNYKLYLLMNYIKYFKSRVYNIFKISNKFKEDFYELFLKTYKIPEKELRKKIDNEIINEMKYKEDIEVTLKTELYVANSRVIDLTNRLMDKEKIEDKLDEISKQFEKSKKENKTDDISKEVKKIRKEIGVIITTAMVIQVILLLLK